MVRFWILLVLASTSWAAACGGSMRSVRDIAAAEFHCEPERVDVRRRNPHTYVVVGCDRQGVYQCDDLWGEFRCTNVAWLARARAAREFQCDAFDVTLEEISPYVFRVEGCENSATYHCEVDDGTARCLRDGASSGS